MQDWEWACQRPARTWGGQEANTRAEGSERISSAVQYRVSVRAHSPQTSLILLMAYLFQLVTRVR